MRASNLMVVLAVAGVSVSCVRNKESDDAAEAGYSSVKSGSFAAKDFSVWMSKADQQKAYEDRPEGSFFVYTEGRDNGGFHEYRHVVRPFPTDKYEEWGVFWGLTTEEFYQIDLKMIRAGFVRENVQVFRDATGKAYHQSLWLKPKAGN